MFFWFPVVSIVLEAEGQIQMMGIESEGMMLVADSDDGPVFLTVPKQLPPGARIL